MLDTARGVGILLDMTPDAYADNLVRSLGFARPQRPSAYLRALGLPARLDLPPHLRAWREAHDVAAHCLALDGLPRAAVGRMRSPVAAALMLPEATIAPAVRRLGVEGAADALGVPWAATWLRVAELNGRPAAVVTPRWSRVRGDHRGRLPPAGSPELAALARLPVVGLRRVVTPDGETVLALA